MVNLSLSRFSWHVQLAVFVVLSLSAAGAYYYYVDIPAQERIAESERALGIVRARITKGVATARQLPEFQKEVADLQARLNSLKPILPEEKDAADLLRRVHTLAVQSNLTIRGFRPQAINTRQLHAEWPISLVLEGTYHNLGAFLDRVSKFPRIINVSGLVIRGKPQPQSHATLDITCTATTFVLLDTPAGPPGQGAAKAPPAKTE